MKSKIISNLSQIEINSTTLVLTANQRLALRAHQTYDKGQIDLKKTSWSTPKILPLNAWINLLATEHLQKICLSTHQELYLWESIIRTTCDDTQLLNPSDTASKAASAWQIIHLWDVDFHALAENQNQEVALFYQWCLQFDTLLKSKQWISEAQIARQLTKINAPIIEEGIENIILLGFDELPPAITKLISQLQSKYSITSLQIEKTAADISQITLHDQHSEIQAMASWAKQQRDQNPQAKIGCIIPQLETLRRKLFNVFNEKFNADYLLPGHVTTEKQFNISAGQRMSEYPIIHCALDIINWLTGKITTNLIGGTLQSPYLHQSAQEHDDAARIDCMLREYNEFELAFNTVFEASTKTSLQTRLMQRLYEVNNKIKTAPHFASLTQWKTFFNDLLTTAGWPGYRTLNSEEYQLCVRFFQLLEDYTHYALVCDDQISLSEALYLLHKQTRNTIFQSEGSQANIQILGVLEAAGNNFDHMWVMGLDDDTWPAAPQPNPFIPYAMQKALHMPHATAERELLYTQQMMHRLCHSSTHIIFSSPLFEDDKQKSPSRLLHSFKQSDWTASAAPTQTKATLESIIDTHAPAITDNETIRGGSWILKLQSECPFKAFATIRLAAKAPQQPQFGIQANERGTIVHDTLERIWEKLKNHTQLIQLDAQQLDQLITDTIEQTIVDMQKPTDSALKKQLLITDKKRLRPLLHEWLALEKKRPAFSITALELTQTITLSNLTFKLRIDRIDTLSGGQQIVIDYKTGINSITSWFGERLSDPQLPLYLCLDTRFDGLAYAQVRSNNSAFKGLMSSNELAKQLPGSISIEKQTKDTMSWDQQIKDWQSNLRDLAVEFTSGLASVTPTNLTTSCSYCDLQPLCRVEMTS